MDRKEFRRKFLLRLLGYPATLLPIGGGVTALLLALAMEHPGDAIFGGIVAILIGLGIAGTRFATQRDRVAREVADATAARQQRDADAALAALRERLAQDRDPRDERLLDELRTLVQAFREDRTWAARTTTVSAAEIASGVEQLFAACVRKLNDAVALLETARGLQVATARQSLLDQRERMLGEVEASVRQIAEILSSVHALGTGTTDAGADTTRIRQDLQRNLEVARRVDERLRGSGKTYDEKEFE